MIDDGRMAAPEPVSGMKGGWFIAHLSSWALLSCTVYDNGSSHNLPPDDSGMVSLFLETPIVESKSWSFQSGIGQSDLGKVNPIFFEVEKSPLKSPGNRIRLNLFSDVSMHAVVDRARVTQDGLAARGRLEGFEGSSFLATVSGNALSAIVRLDTLGTYRVEFGRNGNHRAIKQNSFEPSEPIEPVAPILSPLPAPGPMILPRVAAMSSRILDIMVL